jgi:hypothetical protein
LTKALIFIAAIPIGFQIAHQNTRWCSNTLKGSQRIGGGRNFKKFPAPLPLSRTFSNESVFSHIHLVGQYLSKAIASVTISLGVPADAKGNFFLLNFKNFWALFVSLFTPIEMFVFYDLVNDERYYNFDPASYFALICF